MTEGGAMGRRSMAESQPSHIKPQKRKKAPRGLPCETRPPGGRRPTLPRGLPRSTLGAGGLNFRVRYGTGCAPAAPAAGPRAALLAFAPAPPSGALGAAWRWRETFSSGPLFAFRPGPAPGKPRAWAR